MTIPRLVVFDLDGTLTVSKQTITKEMSDLLCNLLDKTMVAIVTGAGLNQITSQLVNNIKDCNLNNLHLFPANATQYFYFDHGNIKMGYIKEIPVDDRRDIILTIYEMINRFNHKPYRVWGEMIDDRLTQITFSALGQNAPIEEKSKYDPDKKKRNKMASWLRHSLKGKYKVSIGGTTSIDITHKGIDKGYAIYEMHRLFNIKIDEMVFLGDALYKGGNDYPVKKTGIRCIEVKDPNDCAIKIKEILGDQ